MEGQPSGGLLDLGITKVGELSDWGRRPKNLEPADLDSRRKRSLQAGKTDTTIDTNEDEHMDGVFHSGIETSISCQ